MKLYHVYYLETSTELCLIRKLSFLPSPVFARNKGEAIDKVVLKIQKSKEIEYQDLTSENFLAIDVTEDFLERVRLER